MSTTQNGLLLPTAKGMPAGNPRDSAIASMQNSNELQAKANAMAGGRFHRRKKYGGTDNGIPVPQYNMLYSPQGGNGTNPNDIIKSGTQTSTQSYADRVDDNLATKMGGKRRRSHRKYGGNPDWNWGCFSGGKNKSKRRNKTTKRRNKTKTKARR